MTSFVKHCINSGSVSEGGGGGEGDHCRRFEWKTGRSIDAEQVNGKSSPLDLC